MQNDLYVHKKRQIDDQIENQFQVDPKLVEKVYEWKVDVCFVKATSHSNSVAIFSLRKWLFIDRYILSICI